MPASRNWLDNRGSIVSEYALLLAVCALVVSAAMAGLGAPLLAAYASNRHILIAPIP